MRNLGSCSLVGSIIVTLAAGCGGGTEPTLTSSTNVDVEYVQIPHGRLAHMSCVYELETGDVVDEVGNIRSGATGNVQIVPPCAYPTLSSSPSSSSTSKVIPPNDNGWMETVGWTAPAAVGEFSATFIVPSGPTRSDGQVVYLFPGMQDSANQNIIQTVLQYGNNARFGGSYWVMASWFGGDAWGGNYYTGTAYRVNVGEELSGSMWGNKSDCSGGCLWTAWMTDSTYNNVSSISVHTNLSWTHVFGGVLEAHVVDSCHDYPSSYESFYDLEIFSWSTSTVWTPTWWQSVAKTNCGEHTNVSNGSINLFY